MKLLILKLFFIDDTKLGDGAVISDHDENGLQRDPIETELGSEGSNSDEEGSSSSSSSSVGQPTVQPSYRKKTAAWSDPADMRVTVSLATDNRLRKLRDAPAEDEVTGKVYETKLRRQ